MKKKKWLCLVLALLCLPLWGCQEEEPVPVSTDPIYTWDHLPQITFGQWESEPLTALPWYAGRCDTSSANRLVETELGYYMVYNHGKMIYADKANLDNWVFVCNKPDCTHGGKAGCNAMLDQGFLTMRNGRLYFAEGIGFNPQIYQPGPNGTIFVSTLPDGTDKRLEYAYEDSFLYTGGSVSRRLLGDQWVMALTSIDEQGNDYYKYFVVDENGGREIQGPGPYGGLNGATFMSAYEHYRLRGNPLVLYGDFYAPDAYRLENDTYVKMNVAWDSLMNAYLSGDTLRYFKTGDGYYDRNIVTGEEIKLDDPYMEGGYGTVIAPNCILEAHINSSEKNRFALFDGKTWRDISLPKEVEGPGGYNPAVLALTSDSILFYAEVFNDGEYPVYVLYRIRLGEETLRMEYCGQINPKGK